MKVVFCAYDGKNVINGINAWLIRLLPALVKNGIEASVIFITWAAEKDCTTIPLLRDQGIKCTVIPTPQYTEKFVKWILKYVRAEKADVFVPGNMVPALHATKWLNNAGIATISVLHNDDLEHAAIIDEFIADDKKSSLTAVVTVSEALSQTVKQRNTKIKLSQIPCGAPVPDAKTELHLRIPFNVVYIGRIVKEQKRIDEVVTAFCTAARNLPGAAFFIYGSGPDAYLIDDIMTNFGNPKNVSFLGSVPPSAVQQILLSSHVIVLMSDYEGIPVALMEAMGCGVVPVCKSINSGIPELVKDGITGLLINTPTGLASQIEYLQNNPAKWEQLSVNCKQLIKDDFSSDQNLKKWLNLLAELPKVKRRKISIPFRIKLAQAHPQFGDLDRREPLNIVKAFRKLKRMLHN